MLRTIRGPRARPVPRRHPTRMMPRAEGLEDRRLLATFNPLPSATDGTAGSLRAAVIAADTNGQDNTIVLQAGTYQLRVKNTAGQENAAAQGDLDLTPAGHAITIQGAGAASTVIDGGSIDRVFQLMPGVKVVMSGVTIQQGATTDAGNAGDQPDAGGALGGGILNEGTLELDDVIVQNCTAAGGPGLDGSAADNPHAPMGAAGYTALGGGIYSAGPLAINRSIIRANAAIGGQGGDGGSTGGGTGAGGPGGFGAGGGIADIGELTVSQSTIDNNEADGGNGGSGGVGTARQGSVGGDGGDAVGGGLDVLATSSPIRILDSTIAENTAGGGSGGQGGRGDLDGPPSVTPGAYGGSGGPGGYAKGAGIFAASPFSLDNSTVADNQAFGSSGGEGGTAASGTTPGLGGRVGLTGPAFAGGIWAPSDPDTPGLVTSVSSLIAGNTVVRVGLAAEPDDVVASFQNTTNTLVQDGDGVTGITDRAGGNLLDVDPMLGPLQDHGGPTPTMAPQPGSPAIDAGSNPLGLASDQRGYQTREVGKAADIGAFETGATAPTTGDGNGGHGFTGGANDGGGGHNNPGTDPAPRPTPPAGIVPALVRIKHRRGVRVIDPATGAVKFSVTPFGAGYRGRLILSTEDVNGDGVADLVARRPRGHKKFRTLVYSGTDGSPLPVPSGLA